MSSKVVGFLLMVVLVILGVASFGVDHKIQRKIAAAPSFSESK